VWASLAATARRALPEARPGSLSSQEVVAIIRTHQEGAQFSIGLIRRFFGKEMPAVEWASPHVVGPTSPDPQRVVPLLESAVSAPKHEDRAADASSLALVSFVLLEVERGRL
jgi:hypothetical protein